MIHTLTSNSFLFKVHRNRSYYQEQVDKQKSFLMGLGISFCIVVAGYFLFVA